MNWKSYPGNNSIVAGRDDGQVEKRSAGNEADATDEWIGLLSHFPQQTGKV